MKCPRDGTDLQKVTLLGLELDKCHTCDGIWLDRGELERLCAADVSGPEELIEKKYGNPTSPPGTVAAHMRCPKCGDARLLRSHYTYQNPVAIDRCERCLGIWLDDSELNAIIGEKKSMEAEDTRFTGFLRALANRFLFQKNQEDERRAH